jgi:hypothetical protein
MAVYRDYFSFETIRDKDRNVVCYFVTMIGTIEHDGLIHIRDDLGTTRDQKMAFGRVTIHAQDRRISSLLHETGTRIWHRDHDIEGISSDIISFTAKDWRADEAFRFVEGDRVLVEGRAYIRDTTERYPGRLPELSVTVSGLFLLGHARRERRVDPHRSLIPQQ